MTLESRLEQWTRSWRGPLLAAVVALVAGLPGLLAMPPMDRDESRFAQATAQMLETGDYVTINYQDQPRDKKPVGIHWLQAVAVKAVSDVADRDIWPYRLPSLLGAMLAAAACAWGASALFDPKTGAIAGAMFGASFLLSTEAFLAKTDAVLAGGTTLALAAMARIWFSQRGGPPTSWRTRLLFWLAIALTLIIKGPVGPLVALLAGVALWAVEGPAPWAGGWSSRALLSGVAAWFGAKREPWAGTLGWRWGILIVLAIVGPWAVAITVATDGAFWGAAIGGDLAPKIAGGHERHGGLPGYHLLISSLLIFPATLLFPAGLSLARRAWNEPGVRFAVCWLVPTWIMFELLPTKLAHYTLPGLGGLFWLMAAAMREPLGKISRIAGVVLIALAAIGFSAVCLVGLSMYGDSADLPWTVLTVGLFVIAALVASLLVILRASRTALVAALIAGGAAHGMFFGQLMPRLEPLWLSERVSMALASSSLAPREGVAPGPVEVAGYAEPSLVFALGTRTGLGGPDEAVKAIREGRPAVVERREKAEFLGAMKAAGLSPRPVKTISGVDYSNGRKMELTLYRGEPQHAPQGLVEP